MNRQKLFLIVFGVLLLAVGWRYLGGDDEPMAPPSALNAPRPHADEEGTAAPAMSAATAATAARAGKTAAPTREVKELRLSQLDQVARSYSPGRDPWRFYVPPPPPPPPPPRPPSKEDLEKLRLLAEERLRQQREAEEKARYVREHTPPAFTLTFLGTFGPPSRRFAAFSDAKTIYNVREGEKITGNFVLSHIGYESVDVSYTPLPEAPAQRVAAGKLGAPGTPGAGVPPR